MTHEHDRGLVYDLGTLMRRRNALRLFAGAGLAALVGCSADENPATSTADSPIDPTVPASCEEIPQETVGPYPGDGSNGPNVLTESGIVRSDLTKSFGSASGAATGVPLKVELTLRDARGSCGPLAGAAVYLWHCDAEGRYSLYSNDIQNENYLRGVQASDADGRVTFTTVFPGAYSGRWPHIHFEIYASLNEATAAGRIRSTSQLALPEEPCLAVYATDGYDGSSRNMERTGLADDNVFGEDDGVRQLATVTGSVQQGYVAHLQVPV
ncbi:intradiol ring-cleavage dioxygenase [Kribbella deserti]|uniref:Intradiol ring-cleavage dioxygenase n=1 Tax=Kribbella deserti TaxID=1926257 RepID=A0ABV6QMJ0_9ACTN